MERHEWNEQTDDGKRFYRANYHAREWRIMTMLKKDEGWETLTDPSEEILRALRLIVFNKYQRKRCPFERIESVDKMLGEETEKPS